MGHFYAYAMLPPGTNTEDDSVVEKAVEKLIKPYQPVNEEHPDPDVWFDFYWCASKEWYEKAGGNWEEDFPNALKNTKIIIIPTGSISQEDVVYAVVTPDGKWFQSNSTWRSEDLEWNEKFLTICSQYPDYLSVVLYFKC